MIIKQFKPMFIAGCCNLFVGYVNVYTYYTQIADTGTFRGLTLFSLLLAMFATIGLMLVIRHNTREIIWNKLKQ